MPEEFSIQPYLNDQEILTQTAEQIKKDFSFFDIAILSNSIAPDTYTALYEQMLPGMENLIKSNHQKFISLLYRVDISEAQIKKESGQHGEKSFEEIMTGLIIKRCLQKVVLRKLFS